MQPTIFVKPAGAASGDRSGPASGAPHPSQDQRASVLGGELVAQLLPPDVTPRQSRIIAGAALVCGLIGDLGADGRLVGVGMSAYLLSVVAALSITIIARTQQETSSAPRTLGIPPQSLLVLLGAGLFATLILVRDSAEMFTANLLVTIGALILASAMTPGSGLNLFAIRVRDIVGTFFVRGIYAGLGTPLFAFTDARKIFRSSRGSSANANLAGGIARAVLLGTAITLFFGVLLAAGDPVFERSVSWIVDWNMPAVSNHLVGIFIATWPIVGLLWAASRIRSEKVAAATSVDTVTTASPDAAEPLRMLVPITLNRLDGLVALGAVNTLFGVFMLTQLRVLFGGQAYVMATTGLTLAQYARNGFFALTVTAGLVIGMLLVLDYLLRDDGLAKWHVFRRLSVSLLVLVGVMIVSATTRMLLYVDAFGFTVDRLIALAIMGWLTLVSAWFGATVLRGRPARFVVGSMLLGAAALVVMNVINVDAIVARSVISRGVARGGIAAERPLDAQYLANQLGADAVPVLVEATLDGRLAMATTGVESRTGTYTGVATGARTGATTGSCTPPEITANRLLEEWGPYTPQHLSRWTVGSWRARRAVAANATALAAMACKPDEPRTTR
ncbi:MAG TPA: DUF4173 domain-containing protein [Gemmatimonas sp.]|nr:DUF4173 domain-containing protein [Gemmatimonas sp.]